MSTIFVGYKLSKDDSDYLVETINFNLEKTYPPHCTLIYANCTVEDAKKNGFKTIEDWEKYIKNKTPIELPASAIIRNLEWWGGHDDSGYVVANLGFPEAIISNHALIKCGLKSDFPKYTPHMTLITPINEDDGKAYIKKYDFLIGYKMIFDDVIYERF